MNKRANESIEGLVKRRQQAVDAISAEIRQTLMDQLLLLKLTLTDNQLQLLELYDINAFEELELVEIVNVCYWTVQYNRETKHEGLSHIGTIEYYRSRTSWPRK